MDLMDRYCFQGFKYSASPYELGIVETWKNEIDLLALKMDELTRFGVLE
jgi:hypothetical protein